jgi:hypothetical protein
LPHFALGLGPIESVESFFVLLGYRAEHSPYPAPVFEAALDGFVFVELAGEFLRISDW